MSIAALVDAFGASWLALASIAVLVAGCVLPSATNAAWADGQRAVLNFAERLLLSVSIAFVLAILVGQIGRIEAGVGRMLTAPGIALAALFAGRCIGRACRDVRFLQISVFLGFVISLAFIGVRSGSGLAPAPAADWREEAAVVIGASLFIIAMHAGAALDRRRKAA